MNLIGEHFDLLQNGVSGSTSLSSSGERHDAETAHVLTASHYRAVTEERWETLYRCILWPRKKVLFFRYKILLNENFMQCVCVRVQQEQQMKTLFYTDRAK